MDLIERIKPFAAFSGLLLLAAIHVFSGCTHGGESVHADKKVPVFFDLRDFFQQEIRFLQKNQSSVNKIVQLNGQKSVLSAIAVSYSDELAPFANSDINKPSWKDKYQVDSILVDRHLKEIRYTAKDASLKTRELRIAFSESGVKEVWIKNSIHSIISESDQELKYERSKGYFIKGRQVGRFAVEKRFSVQVDF